MNLFPRNMPYEQWGAREGAANCSFPKHPIVGKRTKSQLDRFIKYDSIDISLPSLESLVGLGNEENHWTKIHQSHDSTS